MRAVVVGGSLVGQCAALALSRDGWQVTVLERSSTEPSGGTGIGIDRELLSLVSGADAGALSVIDGEFQQTTWGLVRAVLVTELQQRPEVSIRTGHRVDDVRMDENGRDVVVRSARGEFRADLVVGADGFGSVVRQFVVPQHPDAAYSGYLLWRGLIDEEKIRGGFASWDIEFAEHSAPGARLVTFGVPGRDGFTHRGRRGASFSWFDTGRAEFLQRSGKLDGDVVTGTLSGREVSNEILAELRGFSRRNWPSPWGDAIDQSLVQRKFIGTPIAEYLPRRLVRGAVALIGDAAHVVSPITGAGFHNGLLDVEALAAELRNAPRGGVPQALGQYQRRRLKPARSLVAQSQQWSRAYVSSH
jgi:2-polyprenyl-6-methoxyphenol hydroxylase-like FAD-dependent oxidoreductase